MNTIENAPVVETGALSTMNIDDLNMTSAQVLAQVSTDDPVIVPRSEWIQLVLDAECYRKLLESPHIAELLAEHTEWDRRKSLREASWQVSEAAKGSAQGWVSYAELERRRRLTSILPCGRCGEPVEMVHPFLDDNWECPPILCRACAGGVA